MSIFCFGIAIFVNRAYHQYIRGYNFPIQIIPQKYSVSEVWVIFWPIRSSTKSLLYVSTLNFGPWSTKLGGTVRAIKNITHNDNGPSRNYGETADIMFGRKAFFGQKIVFFFFQKTPKFCEKTDIYLGKGYFFICTTLPGRSKNIVIVKKWMLFLGPKTRISAQKSVFCHTTVCSPRRDFPFPTFRSIF